MVRRSSSGQSSRKTMWEASSSALSSCRESQSRRPDRLLVHKWSKMSRLAAVLDEMIGVNATGPETNASAMWNKEMVFSPKVILYTNAATLPHREIVASLARSGLVVEIVDESQMFNTVFISFGGTDEVAATAVNGYLKARGIQTWFFPDDAPPGIRLHRMMHDEINKHDRVLLICSKGVSVSLRSIRRESRRVLVRGRRKSGGEMLIPITLDEHVYADWAPARPGSGRPGSLPCHRKGRPFPPSPAAHNQYCNWTSS